MPKYTDRRVTRVKLSDIDHTDIAILQRLLTTKKLTEAQRVALKRLLSAWYNSD